MLTRQYVRPRASSSDRGLPSNLRGSHHSSLASLKDSSSIASPIVARGHFQLPRNVFKTCCPDHRAIAPPSSIATMPSKKQPSSVTYPSAPGSDVRRSSSFWSLPSLASTPACSEHSVQTQSSRDNQGRLKVLLDYPAHSKNTRVLEEADIWRAERLRVKLSAMAQACRAWEQALAKSALVSGYVRPASLLSPY